MGPGRQKRSNLGQNPHLSGPRPIFGTNLNEGRFLMPLMMPIGGPKASRKDFQQWLHTYYPGAEKAIKKQYKMDPADPYK